jgi:hypothetical protein
VLALPAAVLAHFSDGNPAPCQWEVGTAMHVLLLGALGRALAGSGVVGSVSARRLAFAVGDEIVYPETGEDAAQLIPGNTAIVLHLEQADPVLGRVAVELGEATNRDVAISVYVADVDSRAFSWHVDKWDNLVLQMQGIKRFVLGQDCSRELCPGDALFLPEDVGHRADTLKRSVHMSFAFFSRM